MLILTLSIIICGDGTLDILNQLTDIIVMDMLGDQVSGMEQNMAYLDTPNEQRQNGYYYDMELKTPPPMTTYNLRSKY